MPICNSAFIIPIDTVYFSVKASYNVLNSTLTIISMYLLILGNAERRWGGSGWA